MQFNFGNLAPRNGEALSFILRMKVYQFKEVAGSAPPF